MAMFTNYFERSHDFTTEFRARFKKIFKTNPYPDLIVPMILIVIVSISSAIFSSSCVRQPISYEQVNKNFILSELGKVSYGALFYQVTQLYRRYRLLRPDIEVSPVWSAKLT